MVGNTKQRKDGMYVTPVNYQGADGKSVRKLFYSKTSKESKEKARDFNRKVNTGEILIEGNNETLIEFLNTYYKNNAQNWEDTTKALYRSYIDIHLKPYFANTKLVDVKPMMLDKFYTYKLTTSRDKVIVNENKPRTQTMPPLSINTVHKLNTFLKSAFNYAIKNELIIKNPTINTNLPKKAKFKPNVYDNDKFKLLMEAVLNTDDEVPIILGSGAGLRRSEAFALTWDDVDFTKKTITIDKAQVVFIESYDKSTKNETSNRTITVPDYVIEVLKRHKPVDAVGTDKIITRWLQKSYSQRFKRQLRMHKLDHIRFHDLRHYNAVAMMIVGISDKVAAERLGHSQVATLREVYQHVLDDMDKKAAEKLNELF